MGGMKLVCKISLFAALLVAVALAAGPAQPADAGGSGVVKFTAPTKRIAANAVDASVALNADSITTLSNCYADPTVIASGSGASVTFGASTLTHSGFTPNALAGKPVAVSGQLIQSGFAPTYTLTTVTDATSYPDNSLAGLTIVAEDVRGSGAGVTYGSSGLRAGSGGTVTYTANSLTDTAATFPTTGGKLTGKTVVVGSVTGVVSTNTATIITLAATWSVTPSSGAAYTIATGPVVGGGATVTYAASSLTDTAASFPTGLAGKTVVAGSVSAVVLTNTASTMTLTAPWSSMPPNGSAYGVTWVTDSGKALVPNSLNGLGILAQWGGLNTSGGTVFSNTATTITLDVTGWVGNGTPAAAATYTVATAAQSTGIIVSNTASVITIAGVWASSTPKNNVSYSINVPAARITNSGGSVTYTRRDTGSSGATYTGTTLTDSSKTWASNEFAGATVTSGANSATVASNNATVLTLNAWSPATPSANAAYVIVGSMNDSSQSFGANAFTGLSLFGVLPASSGSGANVSYGSIANPTGTNVTYTTTTLTDTAAPFPGGGTLTGKTVFLGGGFISGVVTGNTTSVVTVAGWSAPPFNGFPYAISWLKDTSGTPFSGKNFAGRTVISGSSKATVFSNSNTELTLQTVWSPSTPAATDAYTVTPQAETAVVSTNSPTRLSLSSDWSPFAPTAGAPYYLLVSTINASIASNTGTVITTTAPWSPAVPSDGSSYSVANSQPISTCGVGSFSTVLTFDPTKLQYVSATSNPYLTSTGRPFYAPCNPTTGVGTVTFSCSTTGSTPLGPVGTGPLFSITFHPLSAAGTTTPVTQVTTLADIHGDSIAHTDTNMTVNFARCADVNGNGNVSLAGDVLAVLNKVGLSSGLDPNWAVDQKYDLNQNGLITLSGDVLYALDEVGQLCTYTP